MLRGIISFAMVFGTTFYQSQIVAQINIPSYGKGITITANDGSAEIKFGFRAQALFTMASHKSDRIQYDRIKYNGLIRRARIKSEGYISDKKFGYKFELGLSNSDIGNQKEISQSGYAPRMILDAVFKYRPHASWEFWFGQTKLPGNRERVISSQKLQFVDRSILNSDFNIDRDFGVWVFYKPTIGEIPIKIGAAISSGEGRNITTGNIGGFSYTGRIELQPLGKFTKKGDYFSSDLAREKKPKLALGVSYNYNERASRQNGQLGHFVTDSNGMFLADLSNLMADLLFKYNGWSVMSEFAQRGSTRDFTMALPLSSYFDLGNGFTFQSGYLFKNNCEVALRYSTIIGDEQYSDLATRQQYTLGFSKYIVGHSLKYQTDLSYTKTDINGDGALMYRFQMEFGI